MKRFLGCMVCFVLTLSGSLADADTYRNCATSEPAVNSNTNTLWCDDFEDGDMVYDDMGTGNPANDGFFHIPFAVSGSFPDAGGHGFGRCGHTTGNALVVGGIPGAAGTNCAASTGVVSGTEGQTPSESDHGISAPITAGQDVYLRYYKKCVRVGGCNWSVNTKNAPIVNREVGHGGIDFGVVQARVAETPQYPCPMNGGNSGCTVSMYDMDVLLGDRTLTQNQGTNDGLCTNGHTCWEDGTKVGHWYYIEHHIKLNTPGSTNGVYELWMDNCGTTGTSNGCATGGTLRTRYTDVQWLQSNGQTPSGATQIGSFWMLQYSSGDEVQYVENGEWYWDQIVASRVRVGPVASQGRGTSLPAPTGLTIR